MPSLTKTFVWLSAALIIIAAVAIAEVPQKIYYQALLTDSEDVPITATTQVIFTIWDDEFTGSAQWAETLMVSPSELGVVGVQLGAINPLGPDALTGAPRFLGITVAGNAEMTPRSELISGTYAMRVATLDGSRAGSISGEMVLHSQESPAILLLTGAQGDSIILNPGDSIIFRATDSDGNNWFTLSSGQSSDGGLRILNPDGSSVRLGTDGKAVSLFDADGGLLVEVGLGLDGGGAVSIFEDTSDGGGKKSALPTKKVELGPKGLVIFGATESDTAMALLDSSVTFPDGTQQFTQAGAANGLPQPGGTMTGPITSVGDPYIKMGKGNFGSGNTNAGANAFVAGEDNSASGNWSTVGGGRLDTASGTHSTVGGGYGNTASGDTTTVSGGVYNHASGQVATIGGGQSNNASGSWSTVGGGRQNTAEGSYSLVGGGSYNKTTGNNGFVGGGQSNRAAQNAFVGGGYSDSASGLGSVVGGGSTNGASGGQSFIGGGYKNQAQGYRSVIGGGGNNDALEDYSTVGGGNSNHSDSTYATIAGGSTNRAKYFGSVGGGNKNEALGDYSVIGGGGGSFSTDYNIAAGRYGVIPGGRGNRVAGDYSFAAGRRALANHNGAFVWADTTDCNFQSTAVNEFAALATGGVRFVTAVDASCWPTSGVTLAAGGGSWQSISDRNLKSNFSPVSGTSILEKIAAMPITTWNYNAQDESIRHIGPMAQDFYAAFGLGTDDRHIATIDADGVALAAIQGLYTKIKELESENAELRGQQSAQNELFQEQLAALTTLVETLLAERNMEKSDGKYATVEK